MRGTVGGTRWVGQCMIWRITQRLLYEQQAMPAPINPCLSLQCLSEGDRVLPAVEHMLPLLKRGIGVHHSGKQAHALSVAVGSTLIVYIV